MKLIVFILLGLFVCATVGQSGCAINAAVVDGYCPRIWASGLREPRGIFVLPNNDVLVLERGSNSVRLWYDVNNTRTSTTLASASGLNHGVTYGDGYLYASSMTTLYRWPYTLGSRVAITAAVERAVTNIPSASHSTRTLLYDSNNGSIIISVGSDGNIDRNGKPGLYRFPISSLPTTFNTGKVVALGLRNEVGIKFDTQGRLWGVENGVDELERADLGGDIHNENPGEEVNLFESDGNFYGYPYCFSSYNLPATPVGTQFAHPTFMDDGIHTDKWCQNITNVKVPGYSLRAHTAPLDIAFYGGTQFPNMNGDAFVASHGSWNRDPAAGYNIVHIKLQNGKMVSDERFFYHQGAQETDNKWYRPVGLGWAKCNGMDCLLITDDAQQNILSITYEATCECVNRTSASTALSFYSLSLYSFYSSLVLAILFSLLL